MSELERRGSEKGKIVDGGKTYRVGMAQKDVEMNYLNFSWVSQLAEG